MGHPIKINAEIVESRQRDFTISRSFATVLVTKDLQHFSGRLLDVMDNKNTLFSKLLSKRVILSIHESKLKTRCFFKEAHFLAILQLH